MLLTYYVDKKCMVYLLLNCWKKRSNDVSSSLAKAFQYITITKKMIDGDGIHEYQKISF